MKNFKNMLLTFLAFTSINSWSKCIMSGEIRSDFELPITQLAKASLSGCGVELGGKVIAWAQDPKICNAKIGQVFKLTVQKECCDANYDWCEAEWSFGNKKMKADGKRILNLSK